MMQRLRQLVTSSMIAVLASPAFAQTPAAGGPPPFHHGPMWHGPGMFLAPFVMLLALIGFITVIAVMVRIFSHRGPYRGRFPADAYRGMQRAGSALDILEERFARGEIETAEFEAKRKLLAR